MKKRLPHFKSSDEEITNGFPKVEALSRLAEDWFADCQIRQHSPRTIELRRMLLGRLLWFLNHKEAVYCSRVEMRQFLAYLTTGYEDETGRWGYSKLNQPLRPAT